MRKISPILIVITSLILLLGLSGCLGKVKKIQINYYVLDYQSNSEDSRLVRPVNTGKILEVQNTFLPKTYDRNQIVVKENFYRVKFMAEELWADKLRNAIPNIISQRLRAYNIFSNVTRGEQVEKNPQFFLETNVMNIEKIAIAGSDPRAYLNIEFILRDSTGTRILLSHKNQRSAELIDPSMISLVQTLNELIMDETNVFAAKCLRYFAGTLQPERSSAPAISHLDSFFYEKMEQKDEQISWGELMVNTKTDTEEEIGYTIVGLDSLDNETTTEEWVMGKAAALKPGRYKVILGDYESLKIPVVIKPRQRSVVKPSWGELKIVIMDTSKTRVRLGYDIWRKIPGNQGYLPFSSGMFSLGDDEIGGVDKLWIVPAGPYLIKLGGGSWSDLRNFATVTLGEGEKKTLTMIADPNNTTEILVGAGVFSDDDIGLSSKRWHKGYVHGDISLAADNNVDKNKPNSSLTLKAEFDNNIDLHDPIRPFHFTTRSIYEMGLNIATGRGFNFSSDDYTLRSVLLLYPLEKKAFFKNFAFYGRADINTHFFDKTTYFEKNKNYVIRDSELNILASYPNQPSIQSKIAFYPFKLREGTGITYRINMGNNSWLSLRGGYGWQEDYNQQSYAFSHSDSLTVNGVTNLYDFYDEEQDRSTKGLESSLILSAMNLLNFFSINSTVDVLFPMGLAENDYLLTNDNSINIRLLRNLSIDMKLKTTYDKKNKPWVVYDYSSYLRLSLFY